MPKPEKAPAVIFVTKNPIPGGAGSPAPFESLAKNLDDIARDIDRRKAAVLDQAATVKGLTAHEVSKIETLRNRVDSRAQEHARGK